MWGTRRGVGKVTGWLRRLSRRLERGFEKMAVTEMYAQGALTRDEFLSRIKEIEEKNER